MPRLALALLFVSVGSAAAAAQSMPVDEFHPAVDSRGYLTLNGASVLGHEELSFGLGSLEWGRHLSTSVDNVVSATLVAAMGLDVGIPIELGASLPFTIASGASDVQGLGDAGFHLKAHLARAGRVGFAAIASVYVPTASAPFASPGTTPQLLGVADASLGRWRVAVNGGVRRSSVMGMDQTALPFGVATAWALAPEKFELVGEVFGAYDSKVSQLEALGGVKLYLAKNSYLSLGAGRGFASNDSPDFRAVIGIVFEPKAAMHGSTRIEEDVEPPHVPQVAKNDFPDRDNDGIRDDLDKCPDDPETYNGYQDEDGCPDDDRDAGSLTDLDAACTKAGPKDPMDCPDRSSVIVDKTKIVVLKTIEFEFDKAIIQRQSYPILDAVALALHDNPDIQLVEVRGHTDERGDDAYNLDLSDRRAAAVVTFLVGKGVDADRLTSQGYGETQPLDKDHTEAAWAKNRRVEFQIRKRDGKIM
jgi:outer membrane protein OmpA-like peptidoglycan-associated protein